MDKCQIFLCMVVVALVAIASWHTTDALYVPTSKVLTSTPASKKDLQAIKRAAEKSSKLSPPRTKRYTDYQERASAFCTGLCMYEERKSYSDCFDMCSYYW